ncbi:hypothetical protein GGP41_002266 [Bipolaris sorokiniana]|uniref:Uncharacterized protein n=1 Tax=Cochliobolus sativus TaxID=45130 RepID=A0A8H5Z7W1_COCSA|nr:hypothetical protein GGP41_002266 [Bipolaris sorokiniana]
MNDEARTRRRTKSEIIGKGKAKRAEQEANKQAQGKRKHSLPKRIAVEAVVEQEAEATTDKGARKKPWRCRKERTATL